MTRPTFREFRDGHTCARCDGEGTPVAVIGGEVIACSCRGEGSCSGPIDANGDCTRCGYSYSGPDDVESGPGDALRADMIDRQRRVK